MSKTQSRNSLGRTGSRSIAVGRQTGPSGVVILSDKAKGKRPAPADPQEITYVGSSSSEGDIQEDDEEDDFEEVPIPTTPITGKKGVVRGVTSGGYASGASSPFPGTPVSRGTAITAATTPGDMTAESGAEGYGEYDEDESEEDEGVIRVEIGGETPEEKAKRIALSLRKKPMTSKDRAVRLEVHKLHLIALIANAKIRNSWANDLLLRCRLLSLLPHPLVTAFTIPPSRFPDRAQRSRLFFEALQSLVTWWSQSFFDIPDANIGIRTRPWDEVQEVLKKLPPLTRSDLLPQSLLGRGKSGDQPESEKAIEARLEPYSPGSGGERLRSVNSLMKRAILQDGSRDVSAILFVSLCRACGLGTRLVVNLQAVPWRAEKVVVKKMSGETKGGRTVASRQGNGTGTGAEEDEEEDELEEVPIPDLVDPDDEEGAPGAVMDKIKSRRGGPAAKGSTRQAGKRRLQDPADVYRLRKPKPATAMGEASGSGTGTGTGSGAAVKKPKAKLDLASQPPVMWAEVFSRSDQRWIPVDPMRGTIRKKTHFEPASDNGPIRMAYVMAFEEDGYAREVTLRYTKSFGAKTSKLRVPQRKDEPDWWEGVLGMLTRPYRLNRDDLEDAELETSQVSEAMPMHLNGFKDHPIYVLERHLKREEVIQPKREVGKFRGEPVYRRSNVHGCKTAENWMRSGRRVRDGQDPLKWVKQRAMTLNRRREVEMAKQNGEEQMQGLYAEWQTEIYRPPAIRNGHIPQNAFGNIDLYAPTMLPPGAAHLPYKGIAKVAKQLGISYAEACTGFEFKKQRAIPVITGIVVAQEQVENVMAAFKESAAAAEEREKRKREEKALKRWARLISGIRVRERLRETYGGKEGLHDASHNPLADPTEAPERKMNATGILANAQKEAGKKWEQRIRSVSPAPASGPGPGHVAGGDGAGADGAGADVSRDGVDVNEANLLRVKEEEVGDAENPGGQEREEEDEMEEVDISTVPASGPIGGTSRAASVESTSRGEDNESDRDREYGKEAAGPSRARRTIALSNDRPKRVSLQVKIDPVEPPKSRSRVKAVVSKAESGTPSRVLPRRQARPRGAVMVDNPYEESSEDEDMGYGDGYGEDEDSEGAEDDVAAPRSDERTDDKVGEGKVETVQNELVEDSNDRHRDAEEIVEVPDLEKSDVAPSITSVGVRKLRLRVGGAGQGKVVSASPRETRSSKRKR